MDTPLKENDGAPMAAPVTPDSVPGMGEPVLPTRTSAGSGDVPLGIAKPKKSKRVKSYDEFVKKLNKE